MADVEKWSTNDVSEWLQQNGFSKYCDLFCEEHDIDGQVLLLLTEADLRNPPLSLSVLGDIKRLMIKISQLRLDNGVDVDGNELFPAYQNMLMRSRHQSSFGSRQGSRRSSQRRASSFNGNLQTRNGQTVHFIQEKRKTFLSFIYVFLVFLLTAFTMVVVHDRVPDMERYPPLPDIFLDNLPYIHWAFQAAELCAIILATLFSIILILHKHRYIVLRRLFALCGSVFLLRCITMFVTSLSVPGVHLQCAGKVYGDTLTKMKRALEIWLGFGMSLTGVHTCGDYMFSGHTIMITMFNFFITEYSPRKFYLVHTLTWVLNLFGIFFILAGHEHYSIDVIIAFYITSRMFLYYHTLANNRALSQEDKRTSVWFPMFSYFEANVDGIVPNVYEWPCRYPAFLREWFESEKEAID
ncbi:sphingomyelin synthase-related protein 1-like [Amphiura filiformis]|uniref:sphingomyelin synthase-related protein 1-like n=1 Tax=Amphiura filiformis TaxID=82378 RepID=UPI003B2158DB